MKKYIQYYSYVLKHKYYVFIECCKRGVPWRGLVHDLSKLLPTEMMPYVEFFYGNNKTDPVVVLNFKAAWLHHQRVNKHHWQWWVRTDDDGTTHAMVIPEKYRKEMVSDWIGAGLSKFGSRDIVEWYTKNRARMTIHIITRRLIEKDIGVDFNK